MLDIKSLEGKRIAVLLSGGVDSSVVVGSLPVWACIPTASISRSDPRKGRVGLLF